MAHALICTVGTHLESGDDLAEVLAAEVRAVAPDFVLLLCSRSSRDQAREVARSAGLLPSRFEIVEFQSPHNLNNIFEKTNDAIRSLRVRGFAPEDISLNYTTGTKVMGSAAMLAAVMNRCREMRYLFDNGSAGGQTVVTTPEAVTAFGDLLLARRLVREMRFLSARDLLSRIDSTHLSPYDKESLNALREVAIAYHHWDSLRHREFLDTIRGVPADLEPIGKFLVGPQTLAMVGQIADDLGARRYSPPVFADMINNAGRRQLEGKFDDAAARAYRALEMLAQWALAREGIDTDDVDTRRIPPRYRVNYEAMRSMDDGQVRIGMRKAFELLALLNTPVGVRFEADKDLMAMLQRRSESILAHGTTPINDADCTSLLEKTREFFAAELPDLDRLCDNLRFPWLSAD
jgi:CRISPR-associated protein (TIGR02710 family)